MTSRTWKRTLAGFIGILLAGGSVALGDLNTGLVAYYPFDGNANDASGNGNNGTVLGAVLTTDRLGSPNSAYQFDGNTSQIRMNPLPDMTSATFSCWIKVPSLAPNRRYVFFEGDDSSGHDYGFALWSNGSFFQFKDTTELSFPNTDFPIGTWFHFACVADNAAGKVTAWINGMKARELVHSVAANVGYHCNLSIGRFYDPRTEPAFNGALDDVRFYNRALSAAEVQQLFIQEGGFNTGLVAYYPFDGNPNDASGNGHNAVPSGSPTFVGDGRCGSATRLDGHTQWYQISSTGVVKGCREATVSAWVRPRGWHSHPFGGTVWTECLPMSGYYTRFSMHVTNDNSCAAIGGRESDYAEWKNVSSVAAIPTNMWTHVAGTWKAGEGIKIYVNGRFDHSYIESSLASLSSSDSKGSFIGTWGATTDFCTFNGDIDELRIYNRALSATDMQALYNLPSGQAIVSNVRASQRAGTNLVDVWYDLSGVTAPVVVSALISTNGGASYDLQPAHLSGDGVAAPIGSGLSRHLVWDAGTDWPGHYSSQMRVLVLVPPGGGSAQANSPIFTLDTRSVAAGTLTGLVLGNSTPIAGAQVRVDGTSFGTNTASNGTFTLGGVPVNVGYVVTVAASNFVCCRLTNVNVAAGTNNLGSIILQVGNGSYRLVPLVPDVNPATNSVEEGGTAFRYYQLTSPGVAGAQRKVVSVDIGGVDIPQTTSLPEWNWEQAGVSDGAGVLRVAVPSAFLSTAPKLVRIWADGYVLESFYAIKVPRLYDQVWKQKIGGGVGLEHHGFGLKLGPGSESVVRRHATLSGGQASIAGEEISRERVFVLGGEVGLGLGHKVQPIGHGLVVGAAVNLQAGGEFEFTASKTCRFNNPESTNAVENTMKLQLVYGDMSAMTEAASAMWQSTPLAGLNFNPLAVPLWAAFEAYVEADVEPTYLAPYLHTIDGGTRGTLSAGLEVNVGLIGEVGDRPLKIGGTLVELGGECGVVYGTTKCYDEPEDFARYWDKRIGTSVKSDMGIILGDQVRLTPLYLSHSDTTEWTATVWRRTNTPTHLEFSQKNTVEDVAAVRGTVWGGLMDDSYFQVNPGVIPSIETSTTITLSNFEWSAFQYMNSPLWRSVNDGQQLSGVFGRPEAALRDDLLKFPGSALAPNSAKLGYDMSTYVATKRDATTGLNLGALVEGLDLQDVGVKWENGIEAVVQRGTFWQGNPLPLERYPATPLSLLPSQSLGDLTGTWRANSTPLVNLALCHFAQEVNSAAVMIRTLGQQNSQVDAVLQLPAGVLAVGAQLISETVRVPSGSGELPKGPASGQKGPKDNPPSLPPDGVSNYVYGISGIVRFFSTNVFAGTGMVSIAYSDADVSGLDESSLRMFRLQENSNHWNLVGGVVDAVSNIVSCVITQLGTYAIAPPLPAGDLYLMPSTNQLPADGASQMTVVVTNLLLNTGSSATQAWLFTASAVGVDIVSSDADTNRAGVQIVSTNAALTLQLRAPSGGTYASVSLRSVAGDAYGQVGFDLGDHTPPATPTGVSAAAGQSRIWVSWQTNSEPDLAGYRVRYQAGAAGPAWDGTSAVEGSSSPVQVAGTNVLLRGLALGTNYYVAVSAVDTTGNESPLSAPVMVTTTPGAPAGPAGVAAKFGADGTNILMWALSEDDGYNDRDVIRYDVFQAVLPGGSYVKVGEVAAGIGLYSGTNLPVAPTQYVGYAVSAVDGNGLSSAQAPATRFMADGQTVDTDGDGIPDSWMVAYFGHPTGQADDQSFGQDDPDYDKLTNLREHQLGLNPLVADRPWAEAVGVTTNGGFVLSLDGLYGRSVTVQFSTNLVDWEVFTNLPAVETRTLVEDISVANSRHGFYRVVVP